MNDSIKFNPDSGHYSVAIPWKHGRETAAETLSSVDSYANAKRRLLKEKIKLQRDPKRKAGVFAQIRETTSLGHARLVTKKEVE